MERVTRHFNPLKIPVKLQKELPFKSKPKLMKKRSKPTLETKRAVVMEPKEKSVSTVFIGVETQSHDGAFRKEFSLGPRPQVFGYF